ncbi:DUF4153 domain-containing protein [Georgenia faecalis]|uniref:DUF4153 domain-containing protein n=1 Tax=Georgenia faecalis TaxID=2483799 RepID=UPI000FDC8D4B|nr:DUF4153 domain-containing protein [Georgenia faecalis]
MSAAPPPTRPLDRVGSIKLKIGLLVGLSVLATALVGQIGASAGVPVWLTLPVTAAAALGVTQWLAQGMTAPLREMTAAAARMATGDYSQRVTATSTDEVGRLARAFTTMAVDLATADQQRRALVATVSHELRTPLAAQRVLLENLVDGVVRPDDAALATALAQSERLSALVGDLLDIARVDGGAASLDLGPVPVAELLDQAVAEAAIGARAVRFDVEVHPADLVVSGDRARLAQVAANLLDNAARHSPADGTVWVRAAAGVDRWSLEVADEGPGIPAGLEEHVFTRFGSAEADGGGGTGLGLAIASWVCEMHGGSIAALPPEGARTGARIRADLPLDPAPAAPVPPAAAAPAAAPTAATSPAATSPALARPAASSAPSAPTSPAVPTSPSATDSFLGDVWPESGLSTAPTPVLASLGIGALAAAVLPNRELGLGAFTVLLLAGALVLAMSPRRAQPWTVLSAALSVALGSFVVLRDTGWLAVLALLVVGALVTTALTGAHRVLAMVAGALAWVLSAVRGLPLLSRTLTALSRHRRLWPVLRTAALSLLALVVFGGLFASGDPVFGSWVAPLVPDLAWDDLILRTFVLVAVGGSVLAACYLALNPPRVEALGPGRPRPVQRTWEWLVPVALVIAVFAGFVVAQASAMWGGHDYVRRVTGMTYSEYVHQGFGQLTVATALTLATIALTVRKAPQAPGRERTLLRVALGILCALTLVVVASALFRMSVYQEAFGFTVLRVLVDAFELWLGLVVVLVVVAGIRWSGRWLPRAALVSGAAFLIVIGAANPDAWVAAQNIDRFEETGKIDTAYLSTLSPDATPTILAGLPRDLAACSLRPVDPPADLLSWNLGRARAADALEDVRLVGTRAGCP